MLKSSDKNFTRGFVTLDICPNIAVIESMRYISNLLVRCSAFCMNFINNHLLKNVRSINYIKPLNNLIEKN